MKCNIFIITIVLIGFNSCYQNVKVSLIGRKIFFPDSLYSIINGNLAYFVQEKREFILVVPFSGECPACTESVKEWAIIADSLEKRLKIKSIFVMDISEIQAFKKMIYPNLPQSDHYILNIDYAFQRKNHLMIPETRFHGLLLNRNNIIVHDCNILIDGSSVDDYLNEVASIIEESGYIK